MSIRMPDRSRSQSTPTTAVDYASYFGGLNDLTGGRLGDFATNGTQRLTTEQIQSYGGLGATRKMEAERGRARAIDEIAADPNLSVAQRQRSTQLTDQDAQARLDAIGKETEAGISALAQYNNSLTASDLETLIRAYYEGGGQVTSSRGSGGGSVDLSSLA